MGRSYIGRQPVVNAYGKVFAYDLHYPKSKSAPDEQITASLINDLQSAFGVDTIVGKKSGFVRVDRAFINHELLNLLPKEKFIYAIMEEVPVDEALCGRIEKLSNEGFVFALNDMVFDEEKWDKFESILPWIRYAKIDLTRTDLEQQKKYLQRLKERGIVLIGAKIECHDLHAQCKAMGFLYFQGFFISKPKVMENASFSLEHEGVIRLWNLLQTDASTDQLAEAFEHNHMLSLKLIRFINSAVFSLRNPVSSIRHVLTLLGREPLARWIMLLLFSEEDKSDQNTIPLMLMVINRTELMTQLVGLIEPSASRQQKATAYFVGILSLIHLLFQIPHREVLRRLNVAPEIERALFEGDGFYGELLTTARSIELLDIEAIERFLAKYRIEYGVLEPIIRETMEKVNQFDEMMES